MKKYLLIFALMFGGLVTRSQTISNLLATGTGIKWYAAATGGTALSASTPLVNGTVYYASQTINGVESSLRMAVTATVGTQIAPAAAIQTPSQTQIVWNWNAASGATGYKWNSTNNYAGATDLGNVLTNAETGLTCNTAYTRYVWAYNAFGCVSAATKLSQTTATCVTTPSVTTAIVSNIGVSSATLNGNISATGGATVTTRGFKYSTSNNFDPLTSGTNLSESGSYGTGTFTASLTGLATTTTYYVRAFATNSAGTTYGNQVSFLTALQSDFSYTGGMQTFTVPAGIYSVTIEAWGAQGWSGSYSGGLGGYANGSLSVTPGQLLYLYVGGQGTSCSVAYTPMGGGWNGGGNGQANGSTGTAGGGGGASDVRTGGTTLTDRVIVAAGGGGATNNGSCTGGNGGGLTGDKGGGAYGGGYGGTATAGGSFGGSLGQGGNSQLSYTPWNGGGGGGYYGGGTSDAHGSGGGGSSYLGGVSSGSTISGQRSGDGHIKITY